MALHGRRQRGGGSHPVTHGMVPSLVKSSITERATASPSAHQNGIT